MGESSFSPEQPEQPKFERIDAFQENGFEMSRVILAKSGRVTFGTDACGKGRNEDALYVDTEKDLLIVADGMGGYKHADQAARIITEEIRDAAHSSSEPNDAQFKAFQRMKAAAKGEMMGAVYAAAQVDGKKLHVWHSGDCDVIVVDSAGRIKFSSESTSFNNAPTTRSPGTAEKDIVDLMNYDRILMASDGLSKNINMKDVAKMIAQGSVDVVMKQLAEKAKRGMEGEYEGGTADHLTLLLYEILPVPMRGV